MTALHFRQIWLVARLQLTRVFFSKRSFWVYGLALFPALAFFIQWAGVSVRKAAWSGHIVSPAIMEALRNGDTDEQVIARAGTPLQDGGYRAGPRGGAQRGNRPALDPQDMVRLRFLTYFDGHDRWNLAFTDGTLTRFNHRPLVNFEEDRTIYAGIFQHFYLRLAIFFGCLGIFINLFRGEMLDKTLHFWFLAPMRREVLLAGKYLSGLIASALIFSFGAVLAYFAMLGPQDPAELAAFWNSVGLQHVAWYAASAALACLGYGSVFLAAGMFLRNPMIPAIVILFWESINGILPSILQKLSVLYYVQSLAPVPPPMDPQAPFLIRLLASPIAPAPVPLALLGLLSLTAVVLWVSARAARSLEINYGTE